MNSPLQRGLVSPLLLKVFFFNTEWEGATNGLGKRLMATELRCITDMYVGCVDVQWKCASGHLALPLA